ncbi:MAG: MBL fold metallo-hydrolase [Chloroflexi bacterium]|nr:MBL fold metallo-hydrolase [Chloroflexota bacterium]
MKAVEPLKLNSLTPRVVWSPPEEKGDRPVMGAVLGEHSTLIVEAGASPAHAASFRSALGKLKAAPARFVAVTHWHWDHVFGIAELNLPTIAQRETYRRVMEMSGLDWRDAALDQRLAAGEEISFVVDQVKVELSDRERAHLVIAAPDVLFDEQVEVALGGVTCRIIHVGGDHSPDSSVVHIPEEGVVFLGDCFYSGFSGDDLFYTTGKLFPLLDKLEGLGAQYYLLAHAAEPYTRDKFIEEAHLLRRIGLVVMETGDNRQAAMERLRDLLEGPKKEDTLEFLDAFIKGLGMEIHP